MVRGGGHQAQDSEELGFWHSHVYFLASYLVIPTTPHRETNKVIRYSSNKTVPSRPSQAKL